MDEVASLASKLDKSVATLVVSQDDRTRRFIGELLLSAAAYYLLKRYVDKYLEGLGYFDAMAKEHGQRTREFMQRLRQGTADQQSIEELKQDLEAALVLGRSKPASEAAKEAARADVIDVLIEAGAVRAQASNEAAKVARQAEAALFGASP